MKKSILILTVLSVLILSCNKEKETPAPVITPTPTPVPITSNYADYWGCWGEVNNNPGIYDILLTEETTQQHGFQFGTNCVPNTITPVQNIGVFRNDTLILDNGTYEYWCKVNGDTLSYGVYIPNPSAPILFVQ